MTAFLIDTSALVDLFVPSANSTRIRRWIADARPVITISDFAAGEFAAAISRKVRERELQADDGRKVLSVFDSWREEQSTPAATEPVDIRLAATFVRRFETKLLLPDAVHLALAKRLGQPLISFDQRQLDAAEMLGVEVVKIA